MLMLSNIPIDILIGRCMHTRIHYRHSLQLLCMDPFGWTTIKDYHKHMLGTSCIHTGLCQECISLLLADLFLPQHRLKQIICIDNNDHFLVSEYGGFQDMKWARLYCKKSVVHVQYTYLLFDVHTH